MKGSQCSRFLSTTVVILSVPSSSSSIMSTNSLPPFPSSFSSVQLKNWAFKFSRGRTRSLQPQACGSEGEGKAVLHPAPRSAQRVHHQRPLRVPTAGGHRPRHHQGWSREDAQEVSLDNGHINCHTRLSKDSQKISFTHGWIRTAVSSSENRIQRVCYDTSARGERGQRYRGHAGEDHWRSLQD